MGAQRRRLEHPLRIRPWHGVLVGGYVLGQLQRRRYIRGIERSGSKYITRFINSLSRAKMAATEKPSYIAPL